MGLYSVEALALRGPWRVCMIATEISNTFLESSDMVLSLVHDQNWYLKVDQISPTLRHMEHIGKYFLLQSKVQTSSKPGAVCTTWCWQSLLIVREKSSEC